MKEDIESAFQTSTLEEVTKETVIELDIDGPGSVISDTINQAQMNQILKNLRKEFNLQPKNESGGAPTVSASRKKKKTNPAKKKKKSKALEADAVNAAGIAAKARIKATKAQKKAEKGPVRFDSVADSDNDSAKQKKKAKKNLGKRK